MRKVSSGGGQCRLTTWRVSEFVSKFWGKSCLIMVKCAIVTLQNISRLSVICPPFCPFKSTYSSLAFPEVLLLLLLILFPHLCNFLGTCWNHVTSPWYFCILKLMTYKPWSNVSLIYIVLKGFALVLSVFCSLHPIGGLLCHQLDSCCCIWQL